MDNSKNGDETSVFQMTPNFTWW